MAKTKGPTVFVQKKKWVTIVSPALFNEKEIGETHLTEIKDAIGRKVSVSLMTLTGDPQKQSIYVQFLIKNAVGEKLLTEIVGWELLPSAARKLMRRSRSKIEDSYVVQTEDGKKLRIKPLLITRSRAKGGVVARIRHELKLNIEKILAKTKYEQFIRDLVTKKFQRTLADGLKKIYPVAVLEIRMFRLV
ncbi:MAG: hypothetical protein QW666_01115 [Candidatus Woesearchaeota archaeon]